MLFFVWFINQFQLVEHYWVALCNNCYLSKGGTSLEPTLWQIHADPLHLIEYGACLLKELLHIQV